MISVKNLRPERYVLPFIFFLYGIRLFLIGHLNLAPDEAYYWYWSKHLDMGYLEHPPMVAWIMSLFTALGGDTEFFVRAGGLLLTVIALIFLYFTVKTLFPGGSRLAWEVLFVFNIILLFPAGCVIQTPDTPMLFFWMAALYCSSRFLYGGPVWWWYLWGIALGLGLLSKYIMILIVPCLFGFLFLSVKDRHWLTRKEPYLALLIGLVIFSPVVYWNYRHEWVSFAYQLQHGFTPDRRSVITRLLSYAGAQAGVVTPFLFLAFAYYSVKGFEIHRKEGNRAYFYLFVLSVPVIIFFGLVSCVGKPAEANWAAPTYVAGLILMWAVYREQFAVSKVHRKLIVFAVGTAIVLNLAVHVHLIKPFLPVPPEKDKTRELHDWRGLGTAVEDYIRRHPCPEGYFLMSDSGTILAEAVFYSNNRYVGVDFNRPDRYIAMGKLDWLAGKNALILISGSREAVMKSHEPYFEKVVLMGKHSYFFRDTEIDPFSPYMALGTRYRGNWLTAHACSP